jgi:hypothetical protein
MTNVTVKSGHYLDGDAQKNPLAASLLSIATARSKDVQSLQGLSLPCTVSKVISPWIVEVNFEVDASPTTLPKIQIPVLSPPYMAYPIQVGDAGIAISATCRLGGQSGLGSGIPKLRDKPGNLSAMAFIWLGNTGFTTPDDQAIVLQEPTGNCNVQVGPAGVQVAGPNGNLYVEGNLGSGNGATGQFTTPTGQTVTVTNGLITNIY